ncbi:outer membrane beta-barrel protein [Altererythrobacter soli]|uniref:Outer membrane beta-barrel protein n=1 Tax=Croceibacterium soli TaxID=1739690 RepID=A0A6I4UQV1_9SPHN|nr:outer membrane beta-barrel protein [Croceibacterium soli]MXP41370.1 outer membrane beta-barrel protein [Croceibacterium soli]
MSRPTYGQDPRIVTPMEIFDPERGDGIALSGGLTALPYVDADAVYNSNIYNLPANEIDDVVFSLRPTLVVRTTLPRHELSIRGSSEVRRHLDTESEDSEQFEAAARARLDLASRTELTVDAGFRHLIEPRGTAGDFFLTDEPVEFDQKFASVRLQRVGGFVEMTGEAQIAEFDYEDATLNGAPIDLSARDATVRRARVRGSAPTGRNTRVFVEVGGNQVRYERNPAIRNSSGYSLLGGMQVNLTDLLAVEAGVGYLHQKFKDPSVESVGGLNYHLRGEWTPGPTWQVIASADRLVDPSPRDAIPAIVRSSFRLGARKAVSDRLLVSAEAAVVDEDYRSTTLSERRFEVGTRAHYRLTDNVGLIGRLGYRNQNGKGGGRDYNGFAVGLGLRVAL